MEEEEKTKKTIYKEIFVAVITAILISIINYFVWQKQNEVGQNQKLYENKISSIEKFALTASKFKYYNEFTIRIKLEQYKLERIIGDSLNISNTNKQIDTLPYQYTNKIQNSLKRNFPIQYEMHMKCLEFQNEGLTNMLLPQFLFEQTTSKKLELFQETFNELYILSEIKSIIAEKKVDIYNVDGNYLTSRIMKKQDNLLSEILTEMYKEIKRSK